MRYTITGRNVNVTPGIRKAVEEKIGKLDRYFNPDTEVIVTLSVQKDRQKIEKMIEQGERVVVIADTIGFHRATIYNELQRGGTPYRADVAQRTV